MTETLLQTKLYIPILRSPNLVPRPRLLEQLNQGLQFGHKLTLISAPAGFGKTTLAGEWLAGCGRSAAWLSLDEGDNDPTRFLAYLIAALQTIAPAVGESVLAALQSPQPPPTQSLLTPLLNEITAVPDNFLLVLDDYHLIDARPADASTSVDEALAFLLEHLPPQMHLVITTREDPDLPLARLRARGQLTELRVNNLRFTPAEAAEFLNQVMGLNLATEEIAALETRTEGWIAGLQLAAISMQGHKDAAGFIQSFSGSHHFVLDYLIEEVLHQQSASVQSFLLRTSILERLCGPLCDAVLRDPVVSGQQTLEYLQQANLFLAPLDNERRWYRYHHLFSDLLRQRLQSTASPAADESVAELHLRASEWYEENGLEIEAFQHAAAADDIERAERLIEGEGMPLYYRGAVAPILHWLASLPAAVLDARPSLWVMYAWALWIAHRSSQVEEKLQAAETALQGVASDVRIENLVGQIAALRAMLAANSYDAETIITQSRRALNYLHPDNLSVRANVTRTLGYAYHIQGDRAAARQAYTAAVEMCEASGNIFINILATTALGIIQEAENELDLAAETFRRVLQLVGDPPQPVACEAYFGLGRISYEWDDLDTAQDQVQLSIQLSRHIESIDRFVAGEVFLARLKLAQRDLDGAAALLTEAEQSVRRHDFVQQIPEIAAVRVLMLLHQGNLAAAAHLAEKHELPISQARVHLAQGDAPGALALLDPLRRQAEARGWGDEQLKVMVLQAVALHRQGEEDTAVQLLDDALALAEPGGFIRLFVDEGPPMAQLLYEAAAHGIMPDYAGKLLAVLEAEEQKSADNSYLPPPGVQPLMEPLTPREREVLQLIVAGHSNPEIAAQLVIAVTTVKTHVKNIYGKLQVTNRFQAIARAKDLNLM